MGERGQILIFSRHGILERPRKNQNLTPSMYYSGRKIRLFILEEADHMRFSQRRVALLACLPMAFAMSACSQPAPSQPAPSAPAAPTQTPAQRGAVLVQ